jgi:hypothetical protein
MYVKGNRNQPRKKERGDKEKEKKKCADKHLTHKKGINSAKKKEQRFHT